jgi:hypothetical protein
LWSELEDRIPNAELVQSPASLTDGKTSTLIKVDMSQTTRMPGDVDNA